MIIIIIKNGFYCEYFCVICVFMLKILFVPKSYRFSIQYHTEDKKKLKNQRL